MDRPRVRLYARICTMIALAGCAPPDPPHARFESSAGEMSFGTLDGETTQGRTGGVGGSEGRGDDGSGEASTGSNGDEWGDEGEDWSGFDCDDLPALPAEARFLPGFLPAEDFDFDAHGYLWSVSLGERALMRSDRAGDHTLVVPSVSPGSVGGFVRGTRFLPDGDLVVADRINGALLRVSRRGEISVMVSGLADPNGLTVDASSQVYLTDGTGQLWRFRPGSGQMQLLFESDKGASFDGIALSPDEQVLYFNEESGAVHELALVGDGAGQPIPLATVELSGGLLDGMATDLCGNLYVIDMDGLLYRISDDGTVELVSDLAQAVGLEGGGMATSVFTPAINFGSGVGGWARDTIYVMNFKGGLFELALGVPGRVKPHWRED